MPCYSPLHGYKDRHVGDTGKRKIRFSRSAGFSDLQLTVPCGQCIGCRIDRSRMWAIRCTHEAKMHEHNCFITLTYSENEVPKHGGLEKSDLQKFFKRLRHYVGPFRYYACGEYGDSTNRPHYHAVLFGVDFSNRDRKVHSKNSRGDILYTCPTLDEAWGKGHALISSFSYQTAAYVARYVMKKQMGKHAHEHEKYVRTHPITGEIYSVPPEFALMSMRPGIGSDWYQKYKSDAFPSDFLIHEGKKHSVPRYYLDKLKKENPIDYKEIALKRKIAREETADNNTSDRLYVRETVKKSQIKILTREL